MSRFLAERARVGLVMAVLFLLQVTFFAEVHPLGVAPELPLLFAIHAGRVGDPDEAMTAAFLLGLAYDVVLDTPLGLWALTCTVVAFAVRGFVETLSSETGLLARSSTFVVSAAGVVGFALAGDVVGREDLVRGGVVSLALRVALLNALLSPLVARAVRWGLTTGLGRGATSPVRTARR